MAYSITGTPGNDTLNQATDTGPGTIVGLAGNDCLFAGSGFVTVSGDSGNDTVVLHTGNTGSVAGGSGNDSILANGATDPMVLFAGEGSDSINMSSSFVGQTILGGDDAADGADFILAGAGNDLVFGNGGNDTLNGFDGQNTLIGGFGGDSLWTPSSPFADLVFGNEGNDTVLVTSGSDTIFGGLGNDSVQGLYAVGDNVRCFGNEGADTMDFNGAAGSFTILGGNDSADGGDLIVTDEGTDFIFGNGGADTINSSFGNDTVVAGFASDLVDVSYGDNIVFGNEGDDTITANYAPGANTVFGGLGNDSVWTADFGAGGTDTLQGNEGNDTVYGGRNIDTISGGGGNDVFLYRHAREDGDNAAGGGPVELVTDLNWAEDRFQVFAPVAFAANTGAAGGANLNSAAGSAIAAAFALDGSQNVNVAAQFSFNGRTYLAINQDAVFNAFNDAGDLLIDITGATGTIAAAGFI